MIRARLLACPSCVRHVRSTESACPFCAAPLAETVMAAPAPCAPTKRRGRAALYAFGATSFTVATACSPGGGGAGDADGSADASTADASYDRGITPAYGVPAPEGGFRVTDDGAPPGDRASDGPTSDASSTPGCVPSDAAVLPASIGAPCATELESSPQFAGYSVDEVNIESDSLACASRVCLVNHFRGRVGCPYGQSASGQGPDGAPGCDVPGSCDPITVQVLPQCTDRTAAETVYCSCRCANVDGETDDGATYCACPGTMLCVQLAASIASPDGGQDTLAGAYCIKAGTEYEALDAATCKTSCDPTQSACP